MTRELDPVIRIEGKKFPKPVIAPSQPNLPEEIQSIWVSESAVAAAVRCLKYFYPERTADLALQALKAADPYLPVPKGRTKTLISKKAVEAAAESMYISCGSAESWSQSNQRLRDLFREDARLALEAVEISLRNSRM